MSQSRFPPSLSMAGDKEKIARSGYVRTGAVHIGTEWSFEVLSDDQKIAVVTIMTGDGPIEIGLNRAESTILEQKLRLFLEDWPRDQGKS
jgi:hypothetical protein